MYVTLSRDKAPSAGGKVASVVVVLGTVSLITDVSAEMVTAVLPLYLVAGMGLSPLQFGLIDGLYTGASAVARLAGGHFADRWQRHRNVAAAGYGLSALAKLLLLAVSSFFSIAAVIVADRVGKGIRTAPRDALISLSSPADGLGRAFGVHRAMDTVGALLGPLVAFALLWYTSGSYTSVFFTSFCIACVGVLTLLFFVSSPPARALAPRLSFSWTPAFRRICVGATLLGLVTIGDGFVFLLLQQRLDLDAVYFPLLPLGSALSYLALAVPLGRLSDRLGRWQTFLGGYLILALLYAALLGAVPGLLLVIVCLALHGAFYAATDGVLAAAASAVLPSSSLTRGLAVIGTCQSLARLASSVAFGALWTAWNAQVALLATIGAFAVAVAASRVWRSL